MTTTGFKKYIPTCLVFACLPGPSSLLSSLGPLAPVSSFQGPVSPYLRRRCVCSCPKLRLPSRSWFHSANNWLRQAFPSFWCYPCITQTHRRLPPAVWKQRQTKQTLNHLSTRFHFTVLFSTPVKFYLKKKKELFWRGWTFTFSLKISVKKAHSEKMWFSYPSPLPRSLFSYHFLTCIEF